MSERKIKMLCPCCGSDNIVRDAYASWDIETQAWVLLATYDDMKCESCGSDINEATEEEIE